MSERDDTADGPLLRAIRELGDAGDIAGSPALAFTPGATADRCGGASDIAAMAGFDRLGTAPERPPAPSELPPAPDPIAAITRAFAGGAAANDQLDRALGRIAHLDPQLNAFVWADAAAGRAAAARLGRTDRLPLAAVPIAHKDILWTADAPTTAGSELLAGCVPPRDALVVRRLAEAGAISLGKLNTHEFATGITGRVSAHGPTLNPLDPDRLVGGSSCGSAAAVAAGMVAAATATDTGGSIRIPAACCGVVGFKPTFGAVPVDGVIPFAWSLDHVGVIARNVHDAARVFGVMARRPERSSPPSPRARAPRFVLADAWQRRCDADTAEALERLAQTLVEAGAERIGAVVPGLETAAATAGAIFLAEGGAVHRRTLRQSPGRYQPETRAFLEQARGVSALEYVQAQRQRAALARRFELLHREAQGARGAYGADLLICPALPTTAPPVAAREVSLPEGPVDVRAAMTLFTRPFNLTGQPVVCLPIAEDSCGLPIAAQVVGASGADAELLAWAAWIEACVAVNA